jgi:stearoyl-CoA desaturase (delta-9 desaturase)
MVLFCLVHIVAVGGVILGGWSWSGFALAIGVYYARMVVVTAGYHRYFSHRAFSTSRAFQFLLAVGAQSAAQNGVLWWASHHRWHHRYSDTPRDVHSAKLRGFWFAHLGWILRDTWQTDLRQVPDLAKYPELRFLNRPGIDILPSALLGLAFLLSGGAYGLVWGFMVSTVLLWHGSFAINSLTHLFGRRRYATHDNSRNHWLLAIITTGEGWHNNHHHYPSSANQGFFWWEIDLTYWVLRLWQSLGLIWDLHHPSREVLAGPLASNTDVGPARISRRHELLRGWSQGKSSQVSSRGAGASGAARLASTSTVSVAVSGDRGSRGQDGLQGGDAEAVGPVR